MLLVNLKHKHNKNINAVRTERKNSEKEAHTSFTVRDLTLDFVVSDVKRLCWWKESDLSFEFP